MTVQLIRSLTAAVVVATAVTFVSPVFGAQKPYDLYRQVESLINQWHPEEALSILEDLRDSAEQDPLRYLAEARVAFNLGLYDQAIAHLETMRGITGNLSAYADFVELASATAERTSGMVGQRSERFEVWVKPGPDQLLATFALETLEASLDFYDKFLDLAPPDNVYPIRVEIYPAVRDFVAVSTLTEKEVETSHTVALCKFNRLMIVSPRRMALGYRWRDTLSHELAHFLLSRKTRNRLPLWLHEGIAKFTERGWQEPDVGQLHPIQQSILHEARRTNTWVPFNQMMPSLAKLDSGWQTSLAFAEVTLLIQQIIEDGGPRKLRNVVQAFGEGTGRGFKELDVTSVDQLWDRFLVRLQTTALDPVPGYKFIPRSVAEDPDVAEPEPIAGRAARKFTRLGDLLRKEGRWAAAVTEYVKAEGELGYRPASLSLKVAEAMMIGGDYRRAESELRALLVRDPDRATAHWLLGKIALFRSDPAEAIERYEKAFSIAPFHETVIDGLVQASTRLGDEDRTTKYTNAMEIWNATK